MLAKRWPITGRSVAGQVPGSVGIRCLIAGETVAQNSEERGWTGPRLGWILSPECMRNGGPDPGEAWEGRSRTQLDLVP